MADGRLGLLRLQEIVEARCTICHTRERVDAAIRSQDELDALLRRMVGTMLTRPRPAMPAPRWARRP